MKFAARIVISRLPSLFSAPRELVERQVGVLGAPIEDDFAAVGADVEVANRELAAEVRELPACTGIQVDVPEVVVSHFALQCDQRASARHEDHAARAARQLDSG